VVPRILSRFVVISKNAIKARHVHERGETKEGLEQAFFHQKKAMVEGYGYDQEVVIELYEFLAPYMYRAFDEGAPES
jgi:hypothetical protein